MQRVSDKYRSNVILYRTEWAEIRTHIYQIFSAKLRLTHTGRTLNDYFFSFLLRCAIFSYLRSTPEIFFLHGTHHQPKFEYTGRRHLNPHFFFAFLLSRWFVFSPIFFCFSFFFFALSSALHYAFCFKSSSTKSKALEHFSRLRKKHWTTAIQQNAGTKYHHLYSLYDPKVNQQNEKPTDSQWWMNFTCKSTMYSHTKKIITT